MSECSLRKLAPSVRGTSPVASLGPPAPGIMAMRPSVRKTCMSFSSERPWKAWPESYVCRA